MKKCLLMLLMAALFSLLLFSAASAYDADNSVTPEKFEKDMKASSTLGQVRTDLEIDDHPQPDFSNPNLVFDVPAWRAQITDPATGNVISESVIPLENTVAAVHGDVALLLEKEDGWIYSWSSNGPITLTPGGYTLSGSRNLDAGEKVLVVETDGTMHAFYSGGVKNTS